MTNEESRIYASGEQAGFTAGKISMAERIMYIIDEEGLGDAFSCSKCVYDDGNKGSCCCTDGFLIYLKERIRGYIEDGKKQENRD